MGCPVNAMLNLMLPAGVLIKHGLRATRQTSWRALETFSRGYVPKSYQKQLNTVTEAISQLVSDGKSLGIVPGQQHDATQALASIASWYEMDTIPSLTHTLQQHTECECGHKASEEPIKQHSIPFSVLNTNDKKCSELLHQELTHSKRKRCDNCKKNAMHKTYHTFIGRPPSFLLLHANLLVPNAAIASPSPSESSESKRPEDNATKLDVKYHAEDTFKLSEIAHVGDQDYLCSKYGFMTHKGTATGGHYVAMVKLVQAYEGERWYVFDCVDAWNQWQKGNMRLGPKKINASDAAKMTPYLILYRVTPI